MKLKIVFVIVLLFPKLIFAQSTYEIPMPVLCGKTEFLSKILTNDYKEMVEWIGIEKDDMIVSIWTNRTTGTYTIMKTSNTDKVSCIISAGQLPEKRS